MIKPIKPIDTRYGNAFDTEMDEYINSLPRISEDDFINRTIALQMPIIRRYDRINAKKNRDPEFFTNTDDIFELRLETDFVVPYEELMSGYKVLSKLVWSVQNAFFEPNELLTSVAICLNHIGYQYTVTFKQKNASFRWHTDWHRRCYNALFYFSMREYYHKLYDFDEDEEDFHNTIRALPSIERIVSGL